MGLYFKSREDEPDDPLVGGVVRRPHAGWPPPSEKTPSCPPSPAFLPSMCSAPTAPTTPPSSMKASRARVWAALRVGCTQARAAAALMAAAGRAAAILATASSSCAAEVNQASYGEGGR